MSIFDYPRINFAGSITLNPGTANNDDYAQQPSFKIPESWGPPYAGQALGLIDSVNVEARTFGMSDDEFIAWVKKAQTFKRNGQPTQQVPAEWNYYGVMNSTVKDAKVVGVQIGSRAAYSEGREGESPSDLVGADLNFNGGFTDINSEGSPPATQFFIDKLTLTHRGKTLISGVPSKGTCQQINFYRNVNLTGDSGAGCYVYHVIRGADTTIPQFKAGIVFRYYLYRVVHHNSTNVELEKLYEAEKANPAPLQIAGTFAPLHATEKILTAPTGRLLTWAHPQPNIPTDKPGPNSGQPPTKNNNGGGKVALAPAILHQDSDAVSVDFIGTFPDYYVDSADSNDKFDFGDVTLQVTDGATSAPVGNVEYQNTPAGDSRGWLFDFDLSAEAKQVLKNGGVFELVSAAHGPVLAEAPYLIVSNQQAVYAEQGGPGDSFRNQGTLEPATLSVYRRGEELDAASCPPIAVWQYHSTPIQDRGNRKLIDENFKPGKPIEVDTSQPGNLLLTFTINSAEPPPIYNQPPSSGEEYFSWPPWVTNAPQISIRILPNGEDFSRYYRQPIDGEPVGNDDLTFEVIYEKVLRTYYLLFPGMNKVMSLGRRNKKNLVHAASTILSLTEMDKWMTTSYMPRTRDLSRSRRDLLRAWCRNPH